MGYDLNTYWSQEKGIVYYGHDAGVAGGRTRRVYLTYWGVVEIRPWA